VLHPKEKEAAVSKGLSFTEQHRLDAIPAEMEQLEAEIGKLQELMGDPELFTANPVKFQKATDALIERQSKLDAAEEEWMALEAKAAV
jgi:ATP-binding cassette subfamily F protein uup